MKATKDTKDMTHEQRNAIAIPIKCGPWHNYEQFLDYYNRFSQNK